MVDTEDLKSSGRKALWVRFPPALLSRLTRLCKPLGIAGLFLRMVALITPFLRTFSKVL